MLTDPWGLHGPIHRLVPHSRCVMHAHSIHATVLASLADSSLLPIDQNTATFYNRYVIAFWHLAAGRYTETMRLVAPESELAKMSRNARIMLAIYTAITIAPFAGIWWPVWFLILPRILGAPVMLLFTLIQHVEFQENSPSTLESTRSFRTSWLGRFLYMNMNNHVEHHLYPQVPFHALPDLARAVEDQLPEPDAGFLRSNWEVFVVTLRRSLGFSTKASSLRQAPHMITDGGPVTRVAERSM
ncbi:MAG: fatty acid desaturase [Rhodobacteraceae bacterium]|nr:fatty acid desaturase [Paracoccaceae bacterium]